MTPEVIVFPDVGTAVVDYLRSELGARSDAATVGSKVPHPRPDRLVVARRLGGARANLVTDAATIGVECYEDDEVDALELAQLCRALVFAMAGQAVDGVRIGRVVDAGGPAELPDPLGHTPRVVFTVQVHARGEAEVGS